MLEVTSFVFSSTESYAHVLPLQSGAGPGLRDDAAFRILHDVLLVKCLFPLVFYFFLDLFFCIRFYLGPFHYLIRKRKRMKKVDCLNEIIPFLDLSFASQKGSRTRPMPWRRD
jgi:hypothetical protein